MEYSIEYRFFRNMEYSKNKVLQRFLIFFGIWNILAIKIFDFFFKYEYGIFQKKAATTKLLKNLEYGIFHGIFLEYSKKSITTVGGVKFNQAIYCFIPRYVCNESMKSIFFTLCV